MRGFVDTVLEEHTAHQRRDDKIRDLAESLGSHWRQWPELCWKASALGVAPETLDEHRQWRSDGDRLAAQARNLLVDRGEDGRHLSAMEGVRSGLESSLARIETVQTIDDLARFERGWTGIVLDANKTGVPVIHVPGYRDVAEIGKRLAGAEGLDDCQRRMITDWMDTDAGWKEARAEVEKFVELVGRVDGERKEHEAKCGEAGRLLPAPSRLRLGAKQVCHTAERLESRMDAGERNAHIRAVGKDPDSLDSAVREIHDWLALQERKQRKSLSLDHDGISM